MIDQIGWWAADLLVMVVLLLLASQYWQVIAMRTALEAIEKTLHRMDARSEEWAGTYYERNR